MNTQEVLKEIAQKAAVVAARVAMAEKVAHEISSALWKETGHHIFLHTHERDDGSVQIDVCHRLFIDVKSAPHELEEIVVAAPQEEDGLARVWNRVEGEHKAVSIREPEELAAIIHERMKRHIVVIGRYLKKS